jgi:hypothetical protein
MSNKNLEKYHTEDWSVLEYDTERVMRRAKLMRVRFGLLGIVVMGLLAASKVY